MEVVACDHEPMLWKKNVRKVKRNSGEEYVNTVSKVVPRKQLRNGCGQFEEITHKFLVPGHTFLPCDADFGQIEKLKRKTVSVFSPDGWGQVIEKARITKPFIVTKMEAQDFKNFDIITELINKPNLDVHGDKIGYRNHTMLKFSTGCQKLLFKQTYSVVESWKAAILIKAHRCRPNLQTSANFQNTLKHLVPMYPGGRQISALKHRDLMKLLPFMPDMERQFYLKLKPLSVRHECNNDNDQDIEIME